jgi:hypothetical protein
MLSQEKISLLQMFLGNLPKDIAARLATAVELDRLADGRALPHETILEGLRPQLRADDTRRRTLTPLRLFCCPFEDLLVNVPRREKQKGRLLRAHVVPIWHWVSHTLIPEAAAVYAADIRAAALTARHGRALERAGQFWPVAGVAVTNALAANRKAAVTARRRCRRYRFDPAIGNRHDRGADAVAKTDPRSERRTVVGPQAHLRFGDGNQ